MSFLGTLAGGVAGAFLAPELFGVSALTGAAAGASIGGALDSASASQQAANTQTQAAQQALAVENQQFQQTQANLQPYLQAGTTTLAGLRGLMGLPADASAGGGAFNWNAPLTKPFTLADFQTSPSYQFNLQQGQQAINKAAAQRGNFYAPQTLQDISKFSQGLASNEFNNAYSMYNQNQSNLFNRLYSLTGMGQNAAANLGGFGAANANQVGNLLTGAGNVQAAGAIGGSNAVNTGLSNAYNQYLMSQILSQNQAPTFDVNVNPVDNFPAG